MTVQSKLHDVVRYLTFVLCTLDYADRCGCLGGSWLGGGGGGGGEAEIVTSRKDK